MREPLPPGAGERSEQYHVALKARFPTGAGVEVQVLNVKGKAVLDFKGIPFEQGNKLIEALTGELPPVPEASHPNASSRTAGTKGLTAQPRHTRAGFHSERRRTSAVSRRGRLVHERGQALGEPISQVLVFTRAQPLARHVLQGRSTAQSCGWRTLGAFSSPRKEPLMSNPKKLKQTALAMSESTALPRELVQLAERYSQAVARRFPKGTQVKVMLRNENGLAVLDIEGVPVDQVHLLIEVLSSQLPAPSDALGPQMPLPVRPS